MNECSSKELLTKKVDSLPWFHELDIGYGIRTPGRYKLETLKSVADIYFDMALTGKTILDIGCYDGFNSFEARRRGAARGARDGSFHMEYDFRCREESSCWRVHISVPTLSLWILGWRI